jgi:hypothetical protein
LCIMVTTITNNGINHGICMECATMCCVRFLCYDVHKQLCNVVYN